MATIDQAAEDQGSRWGYAGAIALSAVGHVAVVLLLLVVMPAYFRFRPSPAPSYTVKIVDNIPAGDLGTHLPPLSRRRPPKAQTAPAPERQAPPQVVEKPKPPPPPENDKNAIALNSPRSPAPAALPTPTPTPEPTPVPVLTAPPTPPPAPEPTASIRPAPPRPTPNPAQRSRERLRPKATPPVAIARATRTPSVEQRLAKVREQLLARHLAQVKKEAEEGEESEENEEEGSEEPTGGGAVVAKAATPGEGAGVGSGQGSLGIQQDPEFLLYYHTVQDRIKKAWTFSSGNSELSTQVAFAIGPDGHLTEVKITQSSHDEAFDDSVVRAIRRAAPFPAPPEQYRGQFAHGIEALFKLGELNS